MKRWKKSCRSTFSLSHGGFASTTSNPGRSRWKTSGQLERPVEESLLGRDPLGLALVRLGLERVELRDALARAGTPKLSAVQRS